MVLEKDSSGAFAELERLFASKPLLPTSANVQPAAQPLDLLALLKQQHLPELVVKNPEGAVRLLQTKTLGEVLAVIGGKDNPESKLTTEQQRLADLKKKFQVLGVNLQKIEAQVEAYNQERVALIEEIKKLQNSFRPAQYSKMRELSRSLKVLNRIIHDQKKLILEMRKENLKMEELIFDAKMKVRTSFIKRKSRVRFRGPGFFAPNKSRSSRRSSRSEFYDPAFADSMAA